MDKYTEWSLTFPPRVVHVCPSNCQGYQPPWNGWNSQHRRCQSIACSVYSMLDHSRRGWPNIDKSHWEHRQWEIPVLNVYVKSAGKCDMTMPCYNGRVVFCDRGIFSVFERLSSSMSRRNVNLGQQFICWREGGFRGKCAVISM